MRLMRHFILCLLMTAASGAVGLHAQSPPVPQNEAITGEPKDVADLQLLEKQIEAVAAKTLPAVVGIRIGNATGSGVVVSEDGLVMTAAHVAGKPGQAAVFFFADGKIAKGVALGSNVTADAALMKIIDPGKWPFVEKGRSDSLKLGSWCVAIGHPLGYQKGRPPVVRVGRLLKRVGDMIQTDCSLVFGDSGGPLLDLDGKLIGINSRIGGQTDMNLHVTIDVFQANWDRLVKGDTWRNVLPLRDGADVKSAFRSVVAAASQCVVRVKCDGREVALGTIVGPDGWVLTKASELTDKVACRLRDGRELEARVTGILATLDLAMLKIDAADLPSVSWTQQQPDVGQWLATAGMSDEPLAVGIVSVPRRAVPPAGGLIGVMLGQKGDSVEIEKVLEKSPAEKAGLKPGDIITHVNGEPVQNSIDLIDLVRHRRLGETVKLTIKRGEQTLDIPVQPAKLAVPSLQRQQILNSMGVGASGRADDFPAVVQHDTVLRPADCGGPVVDLTGKVVGVNIAHADRTETYCIPTDTLVVAMYELMSGRLSPALLEAAKKAECEKVAAEKKAAEEKAAAEKKAAQEKVAAEEKAAEEKAADKPDEKPKPENEKPDEPK